MIDPFAEVVTLLQPGAHQSKVVRAAGIWRITRTQAGLPFYSVVLEGSCRIAVDDATPVILHAGDFVLVPAMHAFTVSSLAPLPPGAGDSLAVRQPDGAVRLGTQSGPHEFSSLVGHFGFGSPDSALLVSLLPQLVLVRGDPRLTALVQLVGDESRHDRPARDVILSRLLEVLMVEALRTTSGVAASPGLLRGLTDNRVAVALRLMHGVQSQDWTVAELAKAAGLSRSAFFARFSLALGMAPKEYLLGWRMALGKAMLRREDVSVAEVARRVGYGSASAFTTAFTRHVGLPPSRYARDEAAPDPAPFPGEA